MPALPGCVMLLPQLVYCSLFGAVTFVAVALRGAESAPFPVAISVDAAAKSGELKPIWRYFGADEPNYAYMPNGRKLLGELGELAPQQIYFRAHNLLTTGDGTPALKWGSTNAYTENASGQPVYDWTITDRIFDTYLARGVRPYVQLGFMPEALSSHPQPYRHHWTPKARYEEIYLGWSYPPIDYAKWGELCFQWAKHCLEKYGADEVQTWWWELWNEPNIGYWHGTPDEYFKLYDYSVTGVRRALPHARMGGPETAGGPGGTFLARFLEHCLRDANAVDGSKGSPIDFIAFHAKGAPKFVDGHVRMGIANQLRNINDAFAVIAQYPELQTKPIVIGESDPDGCAACQGPQLGYRNTTMYSSYTAASFARKHDLAAKHRVNLEGALTWAFEFEDQPFFAGFRVLATNGIDLPVLNVFRMFSKMSGERVAVTSSGAVDLEAILRDGVRNEPDVGALASLDRDRRLAVLVWHYHDDDVPGAAAQVTLSLTHLPLPDGQVQLDHFRIDAEHSNAFEVWKKMGTPPQPNAEQVAQLEAAGQLGRLQPSVPTNVHEGKAEIRFVLPRQGVSLLVLSS
jgi:xylan 1,4-beta-xylosidase